MQRLESVEGRLPRNLASPVITLVRCCEVFDVPDLRDRLSRAAESLTCGECGRLLMPTPSGFWGCPFLHGRLLPEWMARERIQALFPDVDTNLALDLLKDRRFREFREARLS